MTNIVDFPISSGQSSECGEEELGEASVADVRLAAIRDINATLELRDRALETGLNHLTSGQVVDFLDALEIGNIENATEIFTHGVGLVPVSNGIDLVPETSLAHIAPFDARPRPLHLVSTEATLIVALTGEHTLTSSQKAGFAVDHGKLDLSAGHGACLNSGYSSLTLLLHQGELTIEDARGARLGRASASARTCVAVQIEAGAGGLGELIFRQLGDDSVVGLWVAARYPQSAATSAATGHHRVRISRPISTDPDESAERVREALRQNDPSSSYTHIDSVRGGDFSRYHLDFDHSDAEFDCKLFLLTNGDGSEVSCLDQTSRSYYKLRDHDGLEVIAMLRGGLWAQFTDHHEGRGEDDCNPWVISRNPAKFVVPADRRHETHFATASISNGTFRGDVVRFDSFTGHHVSIAQGVPSFGLHMSFPLNLTVSKQVRTRDVVAASSPAKKSA